MTKNDVTRILYQHLDLFNIKDTKTRTTIQTDLDGFFSYLEQAIAYETFNILKAYLEWFISRLKQHSIQQSHIQAYLDAISSDLSKHHDHPYIDDIKSVDPEQVHFSSYIKDSNPHKETVLAYIDALLNQDQVKAQKLIMALKGKVSIKTIYEDIVQVTLYEIGYMWQIGKIGVASEHYITAFTQFMMSQFYDELFSTDKENKYLVAAAVGNEIHEIGIRMIADMFEFEGWHTSYLGSNLPEDELIDYLVNHPVDVVALSITMPNHLALLESFINAIKAHEKLNHIKVIVGGQPFILDQDLYLKVGADGYAKDIDDALQLGDDLLADKT